MTAAAKPGRARVLVVEDEFLIREMMAEALTEEGFEVRAVGNADDALALLARGEACDVLFTDINLGGEVDGAMLSWAARTLRPNLPVLYASGAVSGLHQIKPVPGATFVPKPYRVDVIAGMLDRITSSGATARAG
jgi:DNA-binding NtrC family response regulator